MEKIHHCIFEYFNDEVGFHIGLIAKKLFFQIKKLNEIIFFLIIIYILMQFKVSINSP